MNNLRAYPKSDLSKARTDARSRYYDAIRPVIEELTTFGYGNTALANILNDRGIYTPHGKKFNAGTVHHLLKMLGMKE